MFGISMSPDKIISEARARIIWGDPALAVRDYLVSNGVPVAVAEAKLSEFELERSRELRRIGLRNLDLKLVSRLELGSGAVAMRYEPRR
jgi:hypothetical protein